MRVRVLLAALGAATFLEPCASAATLVVDSDGSATMSSCESNTSAPYTTIGAAINAAKAGDKVIVCPGNGPYNEQLVITKRLSITGKANATVKPSAMEQNANSIDGNDPIAAAILVKEATGVMIERLTVDGIDNEIQDCEPKLIGIYYQNASGAVKNVVVKNMKLGQDHASCQSGVGVFAESGGDGTSSLLVQDSNVYDYQKNGITGNESGTFLIVENNRVTGLGPTPDIAQNGIQLGFGATGKIGHNIVTDHIYAPCKDPADCDNLSANILIYQGGRRIEVKENTTVNAQTGIFFYADEGSVLANEVVKTKVYDGLVIWGNKIIAKENKVTGSDEAGINVEGTGNWLLRNGIADAPIGIWSFGYGGPNLCSPNGWWDYNCSSNTFVNVGTPVVSGSIPPSASSAVGVAAAPTVSSRSLIEQLEPFRP